MYVVGTAVLQIGTALPTPRRLTTCDGGVYTCVATHPDGHYITRNFSLQVGREFRMCMNKLFFYNNASTL